MFVMVISNVDQIHWKLLEKVNIIYHIIEESKASETKAFPVI